MRMVREESDLLNSRSLTIQEALSAFGMAQFILKNLLKIQGMLKCKK